MATRGRGRPRKPTNLKRIMGNPGRRELPDNEIQHHRLTNISPPRHLEPLAKKLWKTMAPDLVKVGLLTVADAPAFEILCTCYARMRRAQEAIKKDGYISVTEKGEPKTSAWINIEKFARQDYLRVAAEFGMTPSSRAGLCIPDPSKNDDEDFFG